MYTFSKFVHVVAVIAWLGAGVTFSIMNARVARTRDAANLAFMAEQGEWFGSRFFSTSAVITLLSGIVMVVASDTLSFGDLWITAGFAGIIISIILGSVLIGRATTQLGDTVAAEGFGPGTEAIQRRLAMLGTIDLVVLFTVVALMIYKP